MKVFKTELQREVTLNELVTDNAIAPQDAAHAKVTWEIIQAEPPSNRNGNRHQRRNQGTLNASTRAVVRRYETCQYTGAYDPITHQALCADVACVAPQDGELGDFIGAQMAAANAGIPAVTVPKTCSGSVSSVDRFISCGNKCTAAYNLGTQVTLMASPSSGNAFTGWTGACTGSNATCTLTENEALNVGAAFVPAFNSVHRTQRQGRHHQQSSRHQLRRGRRLFRQICAGNPNRSDGAAGGGRTVFEVDGRLFRNNADVQSDDYERHTSPGDFFQIACLGDR